MKNGDRFKLKDNYKVIYTLQKLPDFDLWILIGNINGTLTHWIPPTSNNKPMDTPLKAFGGFEYQFIAI